MPEGRGWPDVSLDLLLWARCYGRVSWRAGQAQASPRLSLDDGLVSGHLVKSGQILDLMGICSTYEYIGP